MKHNQKGFAHVGASLLVVLIIGALAFGSYFYFQKRNESAQSNKNNGTSSSQNPVGLCPKPPLRSPVDVSLVTSVLYPGQVRGGDYKAHGGFRFDDLPDNSVEVVAPIDAALVAGSRYIERGEQQILLDFESECGIRFRFDHLLTVDPKIQREVERLPAAKENDSRTTNLNDSIRVKAGDAIASAVGFKDPLNVSVDFGVYDIRQEGRANTEKSSQSGGSNEQTKYAVCWFDYLPKSDANILRNLPGGDQNAGKSSDYCS